MTISTDEQHVTSEGRRCPACQGEECEGGPVDTGNGYARQEMWCNTCFAAWDDVYRLIGYDNLFQP